MCDSFDNPVCICGGAGQTCCEGVCDDKGYTCDENSNTCIERATPTATEPFACPESLTLTADDAFDMVLQPAIDIESFDVAQIVSYVQLVVHNGDPSKEQFRRIVVGPDGYEPRTLRNVTLMNAEREFGQTNEQGVGALFVATDVEVTSGRTTSCITIYSVPLSRCDAYVCMCCFVCAVWLCALCCFVHSATDALMYVMR